MPKLDNTLGTELRGRTFMVDPNDIGVDLTRNSRRFAPDGIDDLACSMAEVGQLQDVLVTREKDGSGQDALRVYAGNRRVLAGRIINENQLTPERFKIRVHLLDADDKTAFVRSVVENIKRSNPSTIDLAFNIQRMLDTMGVTQQEIGRMLNMKPSSVSMSLALLKLPAKAQKLIHEGLISPRAGYEMITMSAEEIDALLTKAIEDGKLRRSSVRQAKRDAVDDDAADTDGEGEDGEGEDGADAEESKPARTGPTAMTRKEIVRFFEEIRDDVEVDTEPEAVNKLCAEFCKFFAGRFKDRKMRQLFTDFGK